MPILVRNIRLNLDEPEIVLLDRLARRLRVPAEAIRTYSSVRRSLDARRAGEIHWIYHVEVALNGGLADEKIALGRAGVKNAVLLAMRPVEAVTPGDEPLEEQPVVVGFGPAGMFAALRLVEYGHRPIVLERGVDVRRRHKDILQTFYRDHVFNPQSNLLYGEGGAGTYSDGKLYTRTSDPLKDTVLHWLYRFGADPSILVDARPHIGSDRLPTICRRIREHIIERGGEVRFESQLQDVRIEEGVLTGIRINDAWRKTGPVLLATGHSARDTMRMLYERGVGFEPRPFQIGVRIEHPQELVNRWQYSSDCDHPKLPPAEYHVVAKGAGGNQKDCYSFCMCPGGVILPTNEDHGLIATNGASRSKRGSKFANSGLVMTIPPQGLGGDALAGLVMQRKWEAKAYEATGGTYRVPAQRASDMILGKKSDGRLETSYPFGGEWCDIRELLPPECAVAIAKALDILQKKMPGFGGGDAIVTAPETRASSPVRIPRDPDRRTALNVDQLYPCGEGAGYAGGIVSAAVDGIKSANALIQRYRQPR